MQTTNRQARRAAAPRKNDGVTLWIPKNFVVNVVANFVELRRSRVYRRSEANGERVFQPVFVHGLENPCSVRYDHFIYKLEVIGKMPVLPVRQLFSVHFRDRRLEIAANLLIGSPIPLCLKLSVFKPQTPLPTYLPPVTDRLLSKRNR